MARFHLGLIINPLAGLGGPAGLKGSDGVAEQALALGSQPLAAARTRTALECLRALQERLEFLTFPGPICWPKWASVIGCSVSCMIG